MQSRGAQGRARGLSRHLHQARPRHSGGDLGEKQEPRGEGWTDRGTDGGTGGWRARDFEAMGLSLRRVAVLKALSKRDLV